MYFKRFIDVHLKAWAESSVRKPLLLRGARQVGKSTAVRHLGTEFESFVEINFERQPDFKEIFKPDLVVGRIVSMISALTGKNIIPGKTLLFFDEIQACPEAIMSLRFFKEDMPELHVIAAGSLLEFALTQLPTFGVGRIHSMYMYPMTFDEFLTANGQQLLMDERDKCNDVMPLSEPLHRKLTSYIRTYFLVGGMPEVVAKWVETNDYLQCQEIQDDIVTGYEDDFPKYHQRVDPELLRLTLRSAAVQCSRKFVYADVGGGYRTEEIQKAIDLLVLAGLIVPVARTSANGLPLGAETKTGFRKLLLIDTGLMFRILSMNLGNSQELNSFILTSNDLELVNKGTVAEMFAGLEMLRYKAPNIKSELFYWVRPEKNSQAEVDYVVNNNLSILPIEIKAGSRGGMKSLWIFMREKRLTLGVRSSLENFGKFTYVDPASNDERQVMICPLYAMSSLKRLLMTQ